MANEKGSDERITDQPRDVTQPSAQAPTADPMTDLEARERFREDNATQLDRIADVVESSGID